MYKARQERIWNMVAIATCCISNSLRTKPIKPEIFPFCDNLRRSNKPNRMATVAEWENFVRTLQKDKK